jgi:ring-1,2-phenylacetyl-CoA epoxidase subunit PaaC
MNHLFEYTLRIADNCLILGHRLSEWCGHGPVLEQDMAMTNIALDLIGQSRLLYQLASPISPLNPLKGGKEDNFPPLGGLRGGIRDAEDDIAYLRDVFEYKNLLLVEQPNGDFAHTVARQFFFSAFQLPFYQKLAYTTSPLWEDGGGLKGVAEKGVKEVAYHLRWSSEWLIRLGDGTAESHSRMQKAIDDLWTYSGEAMIADAVDKWAATEGVGVDLDDIKPVFDETIKSVLTEATLKIPTATFMQKGGKQGQHSEHLGYILAEMQFLQRAYPNSTW